MRLRLQALAAIIAAAVVPVCSAQDFQGLSMKTPRDKLPSTFSCTDKGQSAGSWKCTNYDHTGTYLGYPTKTLVVLYSAEGDIRRMYTQLPGQMANLQSRLNEFSKRVEEQATLVASYYGFIQWRMKDGLVMRLHANRAVPGLDASVSLVMLGIKSSAEVDDAEFEKEFGKRR